MTEVKPATDEQIGGIKANFAGFPNCVMTDAHSGSRIEADEVLSLIERIEYEVAYKDEYEAAQRHALAEKDAEIARLKAEVERLKLQKLGMSDPPCYQCDGDGTIIVRRDGIASSEAECPFCHGTGRAR